MGVAEILQLNRHGDPDRSQFGSIVDGPRITHELQSSGPNKPVLELLKYSLCG